jgi:hypothetical protein
LYFHVSKKKAAFRQLINIVRVENISVSNPAERKAPKRYTQAVDKNQETSLRHQNLIFRQFFGDNYTTNYCIVLTSLNFIDLTAELTKRIDLTADK